MPRVIGGSVQENRELRWNAILDAAEEILRSGTELTLSEVARKVGVGRTAIYRYVDGTEELITILATRDFPLWLDSLNSAMSPHTSPRERAVAWGEESIRLGRATDHAWLATLGSMDLSAKSRQKISDEHSAIDGLLISELAELGIRDTVTASATIQAVVIAAVRQPGNEATDSFHRAAVSAVIDAALATNM